MAQLHDTLRSLPPASIALVPAGRAADVWPAVGWCSPERFQTSLPIAAVLRSWEARFGARLLRVGPGARIQLLVERPPRTTKTAQRIAARHFAFCDECAGQGLRDISKITASLVMRQHGSSGGIEAHPINVNLGCVKDQLKPSRQESSEAGHSARGCCPRNVRRGRATPLYATRHAHDDRFAA